MPNLENLRKRAKLFVRWHRERHHPVAAQIRAVLPRFRDLTDRQVLDAPFKLGDAQELVARQAGFESWPALKAGVQTMSDTVPAAIAPPTLTAIEAQLFVADIAKSCPPFYGQVKRDVARINLRLVCGPVYVGDIREREDLLGCSMTVASAAEIKQLYLQYQEAGVSFYQALKQEPWGARTFIVRDLDGNLLLFAGPAG